MTLLPKLLLRSNRLFLSLAIVLGANMGFSQELNCNVVINADQIQSSDRAVFEDMEEAIEQFLNTRRWTNDNFNPEERIKCELSITIDKMPTIGSFQATAQIKSARPVFNSNYESVLFNFADRDWQFEYTESQPMDFSENSYVNNLTSLLGYYANIIIGMDYDSFGEMNGSAYYQKAQNIVLNAATSNRPGWGSLESNRNRHWLIQNINNPRIESIRKGLYRYHRHGLDNLENNKDEVSVEILNVLRGIKAVNDSYPNSIFVIAFFDAKSDELVNIFSSGNIAVRREAFNILTEADPSNSEKYQKILNN